MIQTSRRVLRRLLHRTVRAEVVRGFGAVLVASGLGLPWIVLLSGGWELADSAEDRDERGEAEPAGSDASATLSAPVTDESTSGITAAEALQSRLVRIGYEPASGTKVADATTLRPALVYVVGGQFRMGSPPGEEGRNDGDESQHRVQVSSFEICETEVTQAQYVAVMKTLPEGCGTDCGDTLPAHSVNWYDATAYLDALSLREDLRPCYGGKSGAAVSWSKSCNGYRLPTEAEWEFAARASSSTAYSFGDLPQGLCQHANGWSQEDCRDVYDGIAPVGSFRYPKGNVWNILDMHGNVDEWVWDWYDNDYGISRELLTNSTLSTADPNGPQSGSVRVLRGGSFSGLPKSLRSANRFRNAPSFRSKRIGFRCVRSTLSPFSVSPA